MAKRVVSKTSFTSGELSPKMHGRIDVEQYYQGAATIENMIPDYYGGVFSRPGSYFVREVDDSTKATRLIPFEFNVEQAYVLEFCDTTMRVYKDSGIVLSGAVPYEETSPFSATDIFNVQYAQDADTMYMTEEDTQPQKLTRADHDDWTFTSLAPSDFGDGPYLPINTTAITMDAGATTGTGVALVASAAFFDAGHVGALFKMHNGYMKVTAVTDSTNAVVTILDDLDAHTATADWYEGAWSTYRGFPKCVTFYEQRLFFACTSYQPQTVWGSVSYDYENFAAGDGDADDAVTYTLASDQVNEIQWLDPGKVLGIGTAGGVFNLSSGSTNEALTPSNVVVRRESTYGCAEIQPKRIGNNIYYVQRNERKIREFKYDFDSDSYLAVDITVFADHILSGGVKDIAYQQSPFNILWVVRDDGVLVSMTRQVEQNVVAFARHIIGGSFSTGDAVVESVAVIPNGAEDQVWLVVKRTIDESTVRYVEYLKPHDWGTDDEDFFFVDSGLTYDGVATTTLSGLDHLEGEEVSVVTNGAAHPDETVDSGEITTDVSTTKAHVGLGYIPTIKTLNYESAGTTGPIQGQVARVFEMTLRLYKSLGFSVGDDTSQDIAIFRKASDDVGEAIPLVTDDFRIQLKQGFERKVYVVIKQTQPLPLHIILIMVLMDITN